MKITATAAKALRAVEAGRVERTYRRHGNTFSANGGSSTKMLWRLAEAGLIDDGETLSGGPYVTVVRMRLTKEGREALA